MFHVMRHGRPFPCHPARNGFTLIELSVVLMVISLVAAAILLGREMIRGAEVRRTITQFEEFNAAVGTFRGKYQCLPGDCKAASEWGFDAQTNGNGNGYIGCSNSGSCGYSTSGCCYYDGVWKEYTNFWYHMVASGFLPYSIEAYRDDPANRPKYTITGVATPPVALPPAYKLPIPAYSGSPQIGGWSVQADIGLYNEDGNYFIPQPHYFLLGNLLTFVQPDLYLSYAPADLYAIDSKTDDGLPLSGKARATTGEIEQPGPNRAVYSANSGPPGESSAFCINGTTSPFQYNTAYPGTAGQTSWPNGMCGLVIKAGF